ncbi:hypothetical protein IHE61_31010 [Streptomyces sp. GKU 257-1]|nr:hypothetical protein [Streptomyces sp. GKU 257-1]
MGRPAGHRSAQSRDQRARHARHGRPPGPRPARARTAAGWFDRARHIRPDALPHTLYVPTTTLARNHGRRPGLATLHVYDRTQTTAILWDHPPVPVLRGTSHDTAVRDTAAMQLAMMRESVEPDADTRATLGALGRAHYRRKFATTADTAHTEGESVAHLAALILHTPPEGDAPHPRMTPPSHLVTPVFGPDLPPDNTIPQAGDPDPYAVTLATIARVVHTGRQMAETLHTLMRD